MKLYALIFFYALCTVLFSVSFPTPREVYILDIKGRGQYKKNEEASWQPLKRKIKLAAGSYIRSGPRSLITVRFTDRGTLFIKDASFLLIRRINFSKQVYLHLYEGKARVLAFPGTEKGFFKMESRSGRALLHKGDMCMHIINGITHIYQFAGLSAVNNVFHKDKDKTLKKDSYLYIDKNLSLSKFFQVPDKVYKEWDINLARLHKGKHQDLVLSDGPAYTMPPADTAPAGRGTETAVTNKKKVCEEKKSPWQFTVKHKLKAGYFREPGPSGDKDYGYTLKSGSKIRSNFGHWINLTYMPEITFGPFSAGLYLPFYIGFREQFYLAENFYNWEDYNFDIAGGDWVNDLIDKVIYFKYTYRYFTFKIGGFEQVTFGSGYILNSYSTMLEFPSRRVNGLDITYFNRKKGLRATYFNGDLSDNILSALRLELFPFLTFGQSSNKALQQISSGFSLVYENDTVRKDVTNSHGLSHYRNTSAESVTGYGIDLMFPLSKEKFKAMLYFNTGFLTFRQPLTNMAASKTYGPGISAGLKGNASMASFRAEIYYNTRGFLAEYFNAFHYYDLQRADALSGLLSQKRQNNLGWLLTAGVELKDTAALNITFSEFFKPVTKAHPNYRFVRNYFRIEGELKEGVYERFYGSLYYYKDNIVGRKFFKAFFKNALIGAEVHFKIAGPLEMIFLYQMTLDENGGQESSYAVDFAFDFNGKDKNEK
ncbi:MAG TPA: hypothetical protein VKS21_00820 [Spirochaetota bacterium]|nr:hypothetical protein [Spirochaetota bacterium]